MVCVYDLGEGVGVGGVGGGGVDGRGRAGGFGEGGRFVCVLVFCHPGWMPDGCEGWTVSCVAVEVFVMVLMVDFDHFAALNMLNPV